MITNKLKGHTAVLVSNLIFGLNIPVTKALLDRWMTPLGYMSVRTLVAVIIFWTISRLVPREKVAPKDLLVIAVGGIMGFIISQFLTAVSLQYTTPVYFSLILALSPMVVMLLAALFLKEPVSRKKVAGVILGVAGAMLLVLNIDNSSSGNNNLFGVFLAILSIIAYSVYLIIMRSVAQKYSAVTQMKWMFLFTAIIILPLGAKELDQQAIFSSAWEWSGILELGFVVLLATSVGYFLMPFGMKYLRATTVSVYMNLQPVISSIAAIWVGQDIFTWDKPMAAILVIAGAYIVAQSPEKQQTDIE